MKVIQAGFLPDYTHQGTCHKCGCMVEGGKKDGEVVIDTRENTTFIRVKCPTTDCGNEIIMYLKRK